MKDTNGIGAILALATVLCRAAMAGPAPSDPTDFSRYQVIVDGNIFGLPEKESPAPVVPQKKDPAPVPPHILRLCGITQERDTAWVAFVSDTSKKSYYMELGQEEDGIRLLKADVVEGRVLIRWQGEDKWLAMRNDAAAATPGSPAFVAALGDATQQREYYERKRNDARVALRKQLEENERLRAAQEEKEQAARANDDDVPPSPTNPFAHALSRQQPQSGADGD